MREWREETREHDARRDINNAGIGVTSLLVVHFSLPIDKNSDTVR